MDEDALIQRYFSFDADSPDLIRGPGDDAALLRLAPGTCAISTDLFLQGAHFDPGDNPVDLGHKALAVNLSDLAAMGATPVCFTLALAMPRIDEPWIAGFSEGIKGLAREYEILLAGGDLSRGELGACITVVGTLEGDAPALRRDAAVAGDRIGVTGTVGDAALARLHLDKEGLQECRNRLYRPQPRIEFGRRIRGHAHAAMDISDGILKDLGRLLKASGQGGLVELARIPLSGPVASEQARTGDWFTVLGGGEDYELVFTVPKIEWEEIEAIGRELDIQVSNIGTVEAGDELKLVREGVPVPLPSQLGYDHFSSA